LPGGHAGIDTGPVIERDGDVFGRTVNRAARLSDLAPDGAVYLTAATADAIAAGPFGVRLVGEADLQGIGPTRLFRLDR
jgi:adenylate cyclase